MQKIWNGYRHYQDIYDWISSFYKQSALSLILTQKSIGKMSMVNLVIIISIFTLLKHFSNAFQAIALQGFIFIPNKKHLIAAQIF